MRIRCYEELVSLRTFEERLNYLKLHDSKVGDQTFGMYRYVNQSFYHGSKEWKAIRDKIIVRDSFCDLGCFDHPLSDYDIVIIHHMVPISLDDINLNTQYLLNPRYLITTSQHTHNLIHYGNLKKYPDLPIERKKNDTCPWKK